jgi:hypothetical protein
LITEAYFPNFEFTYDTRYGDGQCVRINVGNMGGTSSRGACLYNGEVNCWSRGVAAVTQVWIKPLRSVFYRPISLIHSTLSAHLANVKKALDAPAPSIAADKVKTHISEQAKRPIYNGRPYHRLGSPVVIYKESLAQLQHDLSDLLKVERTPASHEEVAAKLCAASLSI